MWPHPSANVVGLGKLRQEGGLENRRLAKADLELDRAVSEAVRVSRVHGPCRALSAPPLLLVAEVEPELDLVERLIEYFGERKYLTVRIGDLGTRGEVEVGREATPVAE
jgi:hypothetical protein